MHPDRGGRGAALRITATVDRSLAACPLRFLLGGTRFGPDVPVGPDGSISLQRPVPGDATPGGSTVRLTTTGGQILAEAPFEILPTLVRRWWQRVPLKIPLAAGAFLLGLLARAALARWRRGRERAQAEPPPEDVRVEPHGARVDARVESDHDTPTVTVRLEPHSDASTRTLEEVTA